jgi:hypothetical protein
MIDEEMRALVRVCHGSGESWEDIEGAVYTGIWRSVGMDSSMTEWSIKKAKEIVSLEKSTYE